MTLPNEPDHLSDDVLERYRRRALAAAELLSVADHLVACETCRAALAGRREDAAALDGRLLGLLAGSKSGDAHVSPETLSAYCSGDLPIGEHEAVHDHLDGCELCAAALDALAEFDERMRRFPAKVHAPGPTRPSFSPARWTPRRVLVPAAALLACVGLAAIAVRERSDIGAARRRIASLEAENRSLQGRAARSAGTRTGVVVRPTEPKGGPPGSEATLDLPRDLLVTLGSAPRALGEAPNGGPPGGRFGPIAPVATAVLDDRPELRWTPRPGATAYTALLLNMDLQEVARSGALAGTAWRPDRALGRGAVYQWKVIALKDGRPIATAPDPSEGAAKFMVLGGEKASALDRVRRAFPGPSVVAALLDARAGLLDDSEADLRAVLSSRPGDPIAARLLRDLRAARGEGPARVTGG